MELSLSIGGSGGGPSRKRGISGSGGDRFWTCQQYRGGDNEEINGGSSPCKNATPVRLDLKLSWSTDTDGGAKSPYSEKSSGGLDLDVNEIPVESGSFKHSEVGSSSCDSRLRDAGKRGDCIETRDCSRYSDEEEGGGSTSSARKKLRLSKEQSGFLEESFKEHPTLNPKQKVALAKRLNLQPRQVEVWFQNRRARTKLKQTEVDCEHWRRFCERLTEENRKLKRELQDLKALKSSPPHNPFHLRGPPTMLSMCPSCELLNTTTSGKATGTFGVSVPKTRFFPFAQRTSAAS